MTATVEWASLTDTFTVHAALTREQHIDAAAPGEGVVTAVNPSLQSGDVAAGSWLLAVNDRPVFLLQGPFALFRDLVGGTHGSDVTMVQASLRTAGYEISQGETGRVGRTTQDAFARLYESAGYPPPEPAPESAAEVTSARNVLQELESAIPVDSKAVDAAKAKVIAAERAAGPTLPMDAVVVAPYSSASVHLEVIVGSRVTVGGPLAELRTGAPMWSASVPPSVATGLGVGTPCQVTVGGQNYDTSLLSDPSPATVPTAAPTSLPGTGTGETLAMDLRIAVPAGATPDPAEALVTIDRSTIHGSHLVVPATAIVSRGERGYVARMHGDMWQEVPVTILGEQGGRVAVDAEGLEKGDQVRVRP